MQRIFHYASDRSRQQKIDLFFASMRPTPHSRVLDLGGEANQATQLCKQLLNVYPYRKQLVLVNLLFSNVQVAASRVPGLKCVCGDGLRLPFADKAFDICYCNAVIEHLFNWKNQLRLASEIMRVARRWFVTTPNRWFPFEPHLRLPFVTWLPQRWQHRIGRRFGYHHLRGRYAKGGDFDDIRLLAYRDLRRLFPGSRIIRNGLSGLTPTFIVVGGEGLRPDDAAECVGQVATEPQGQP